LETAWEIEEGIERSYKVSARRIDIMVTLFRNGIAFESPIS